MAAHASLRSGVARASQRKPALPLATIAAKGGVVSCAIEAAIPLIVIICVERASWRDNVGDHWLPSVRWRTEERHTVSFVAVVLEPFKREQLEGQQTSFDRSTLAAPARRACRLFGPLEPPYGRRPHSIPLPTSRITSPTSRPRDRLRCRWDQRR
jgi:hypothetical protein